MRTFFAGAVVLALFALSAPRAQAQVQLGPQLSMAEDVDFGLGVNVELPLSSLNENLEFSGNFTLYFPDRGDYWEIDGNVRYLFPPAGSSSVIPFVMGGLAIGRSSWDEDDFPDLDGNSDSELALRLGGGAKFPMGRVTPFVDLGLTIGDLPDFVLRGGLTFPLRSRPQ